MGAVLYSGASSSLLSSLPSFQILFLLSLSLALVSWFPGDGMYTFSIRLGLDAPARVWCL